MDLIMQFIEKNIFFKLAVYAIECIITGGSIVVTPLLIIKTITGTKQEAFVNAYILDSLKQSNIGKAITASISSSIVIFSIYVCNGFAIWWGLIMFYPM